VATVASLQLCAGRGDFRILEMQWGEVPWRGDLLEPAERFEKGEIAVGSGAGLGVKLNEELVRNHRF
jgi:galactonate dehydratase